jgi:AcrR family transcriptional regulator
MAQKQSRGKIRNSKLQKVAAELFLKRGYDGVTVDDIVELAGGSKSTVYSEFGGKCGLFISSIQKLCCESSVSLAEIDYTGLNLRQSLHKLSFEILKIITAKRSVDLYRLVIGEAAHCPELGEAWYTHGPMKTTSFIRAVLDNHKHQLRNSVSVQDLAVALHDALIGDVLYRLLAGIDKRPGESELDRKACIIVETILADHTRQ